MPQIKAAKKALRVSERKQAINDKWRRKLRVSLRSLRDALSDNNKKEAQKALSTASSTLDRAAKRNIIHPNKASRKKSRLQKAVSALGQPKEKA